MKIIRRRIRIIVTLTILIALIILGTEYTGDYVDKASYPIKYSQYVNKYADEFGLDPWLVLSVIRVESKFDEQARSNKDARGLMQITPQTGEWAADKLNLENFDAQKLYDPETNIRIGCWYLDNLRTEFDNELELVVAAYNGGSGNVTKWLKDSNYSDDGKSLKKIPFEETKNYVERVFNSYEKYKEIYTGN